MTTAYSDSTAIPGFVITISAGWRFAPNAHGGHSAAVIECVANKRVEAIPIRCAHVKASLLTFGVINVGGSILSHDDGLFISCMKAVRRSRINASSTAWISVGSAAEQVVGGDGSEPRLNSALGFGLFFLV